jgi:hypothetical protein
MTIRGKTERMTKVSFHPFRKAIVNPVIAQAANFKIMVSKSPQSANEEK